ncbi:DUF551 domain-containing protein [Enterobacter hormaechei]|uniref:DUF551 domain-containing protein n=1 Tax=Enterobacter hormaechei TaxID=158836 RepID=UPI0023B18957|nr:DUF551 domain-containing protein [Enterobacter hormaechei]MDE7644299.1 DUF551 domain-containing protein [Enterobacter hormaechei]
MAELTKEWLLTTIAELEEERDATPGAVNEDVAIALAAMKLALASLEAKSKLSNFIATQESLGVAFERVLAENIEELYVPSKSTPPAPVSDSPLSELLGIAKRAADEADECAHAEFSDDSMKHSAAIVDWERRAAMLQNGNSPAQSDCCPEQNYIAPAQDGDSPVLPDGWVTCSERMPMDGFDVLCASEFDGPGDWRRKVGYWHRGKWVVYGASWTPTHWMPLPAAPQHK